GGAGVRARRGPVRIAVAIGVVAALMLASAAVRPARGESSGTERFGALEFPRDEHLHPDGRDYWWGAADLMTTAGNRYSISIAFDQANGIAFDGHELFPHQGPYKGETIASEEGPANWGHAGENGRY